MENISVIRRSSNGITQLSLETALLEKRIIVLNDEITKETANRVIEQLIILGDSEEPVTMIIGSNGGAIQDGMSIIDVMHACSFPICTVAVGLAASFGAVLLAAGTKGRRYISEHGRIMIHEPLISGGVGGNCTKINSIAKEILQVSHNMNQLLCDYTGQTMKTMSKLTSYDNYMDAEEARKYGFVDRIIAGDELRKILANKG